MTYNPFRPEPAQYPIAKEGHPFILAGAGCAVFFLIFDLLFLFMLALFFTIFAIYFFRNPNRHSSSDSNCVISPADGTIVYVGEALSPISKSPSLKISIFMSVANVHVNRYPISGTVLETAYFPGKFLVASLDKASEQNERSALLIEDGFGRRIEVVQIAGLVARRIVSYANKGASVARGERLGLIRFGSRVDVYLPSGFSPEVVRREKVKAGATVLGRFS